MLAIWPKTMQGNKHTAFSSGMKQWISYSVLSYEGTDITRVQQIYDLEKIK